MKRLFIFTLLFIVFGLSSLLAQKKTSELGILVGRSYYIGELNPSTHFGKETGSLNYGILFRRNLNYRYALKATLAQTELRAADEYMDFAFNQARNAKFQNLVTELAGSIEFNFLPYAIGHNENPFTPYLFVGANVFISRPETYIDDIQVEGSTTDKITSLAFSFGPGFKLNISPKIGLSFEWGFRKTNNDNIDGLPNRQLQVFELGKEYDNDWFVSSNFMLTFKVSGQSKCPVYDNF